MPASGSAKAHTVQRVVDVLEFFDEDHPQVTVTDLVRRFDWPQSSTSELLCGLVESGFLYKDLVTRTYWPTPRVALICRDTQPSIVRDGSLLQLMDRLTQQTGLGVGIFSMVGLNVQVCCWRPGQGKLPRLKTSEALKLRAGNQEYLYDSAAGLLLLSTVDPSRRDCMIRHLNADAAPERKFAAADLSVTVQQCGALGYVSGEAGFGAAADLMAVLLPGLPAHRPLAIGFAYEPSERIDTRLLLRTLQGAVARLVPDEDSFAGHDDGESRRVVRLFGEA